MAITFGSTRSTPRTWREAEGDRDDPRPGWLSAAEAGDPIHRRDCATVAPRTGAKAACTAPDGSGRPVVGRSVVARASRPWPYRRTLYTVGERKAGCTRASWVGVAVPGRCGPTRLNWTAFGR